MGFDTIATSFGRLAFESLAEILAKRIEKYIEEKALSRKSVESIIYFTMFNPRVSDSSASEFIKDLLKNVDQKVEIKEFPWKTLYLVGKTVFIIEFYVTKLGSILFYDAIYREFIDALEVGNRPELVKDKDLPSELGLNDPQILEKISDITIVISPYEKPRAEDVYRLIKIIYDKGAQDFGVDRSVAKIRIYGPNKSRELNNIEKKLRELKVRIYRSSNNIEKLTVVLNTPSEILNERIYKAIYSGSILSIF
jgi:hypothetical protein